MHKATGGDGGGRVTVNHCCCYCCFNLTVRQTMRHANRQQNESHQHGRGQRGQCKKRELFNIPEDTVVCCCCSPFSLRGIRSGSINMNYLGTWWIKGELHYHECKLNETWMFSVTNGM